MSRRVIYRLIGLSEGWVQGTPYLGTAKDLSDGFIHLSTKSQMRGTYKKHFSGQEVHLMSLDLDLLEKTGLLQWEPARSSSSRSDGLYAHFYGKEGLPAEAILEVGRLVE